MKYIDKVIKMNSDYENFVSGVRLELDNLELQIIFNTLEQSIELDNNPLYNSQKKLLDKFQQFYEVINNGYLKNIEID